MAWKRQIAWSALILPELEQRPLYDSLNIILPYDGPANATGGAIVLDVYLCPSWPRDSSMVGPLAAADYGGNIGQEVTGKNDPQTGTLIMEKTISLAAIRDGASQTFLVGEDAGFTNQWINGLNIFDVYFPINKTNPFDPDFRAAHPGGAQALYCDGSAQFLKETTDLRVLAAQATRAGGEIVGASQ